MGEALDRNAQSYSPHVTQIAFATFKHVQKMLTSVRMIDPSPSQLRGQRRVSAAILTARHSVARRVTAKKHKSGIKNLAVFCGAGGDAEAHRNCVSIRPPA